MNNKNTSKVEQPKSITNYVKLEVTTDQALEMWEQYQSLKDKLQKEGDFILFKTSQGPKEAPTKQWRTKLERFFGLSVKIVSQTRWAINGDWIYKVNARVSNKGGLYHEATGACSTEEKAHSGTRKHHDAITHAETRAKNRAVFEFVGFGEVSAEEMEEGQPKPQQQSVARKLVSQATAKQIAMLHSLLTQKGISKEKVYKRFKVKSTKDLTKEQASKTIEALLKLPDKK